MVYLARDVSADRLVAIKVLRPELSATVQEDRFVREVSIATRLTHPNILPVLESGTADGLLYFVMPHVDGESLRARLDRERQLPIDSAIALATQIAAALGYAHDRGIVHRDVKPENILLLGEHALLADFGLARAIEVAAGDRLTESGLALGTPSYMSPEQASGERHLDARADQYSLACVLFETIAGIPPFHGATAQAIVAHHMKTTPPSLCGERSTCPAELDAAVTRALSKVPGDRFRSVAAFVTAFTTPTASDAGEQRLTEARHRYAPWILGMVAIVAGIAGALTFSRPRVTGDAPVVAARYLVVPFSHGSATTAEDAHLATRRTLDAFGEWRDLTLADARLAASLMTTDTNGRVDVSVALAAARRLGAAHVVLGGVERAGDSVLVEASVYDVTSGQPMHERRITHGAHAASATDSYRSLVSGLLRPDGEVPWRAGEERRMTSLLAWRSYDSARVAAARWNLPAALPLLRAALAAEPGHARAQLWLARVLLWQDESDEPHRRQERLAASRQAVALGAGLSPRERSAASALLALAAGDFPGACNHYRAMLSDAADFEALAGLGECQSRDLVVVVRQGRPAFRGSYHAAAGYFERSLEHLAEPHPAYPYRRLRKVLVTETYSVRIGVDSASREQRYAAYPSLVADTIAYEPRELVLVASAGPGALPTTLVAAVDRNVEVMRTLLVPWVASSGASAGSREMLAQVLETGGYISARRVDATGALVQIAEARRLAGRDSTALRLAVDHVRLLLKADRFEEARALSDSTLSANREPSTAGAELLVGLAALTGRVARASELLSLVSALPGSVLRDAEGRELALSPDILQTRAVALSHSALGICDAPVRQLERRARDVIEGTVIDAQDRAGAVSAVISRPISLAFPCLDQPLRASLPPSRVPMIRLQRALARGDRVEFQATFDALMRVRRLDRPGSVATDYLCQEAWLLAEMGDTARAIAHLDRSLGALAHLGGLRLNDVGAAAGFPRAMALRAELASARGDSTVARHWAQRVIQLWANADAPLQPVVARMRTLM